MKKLIALIFITIIIVLITTLFFYLNRMAEDTANTPQTPFEENEVYTNSEDNIPTAIVENEVEENKVDESNSGEEENSNVVRGENTNLTDFDLSFLKMEQDEKNLIYSPLSIKYALKMLEEATEGKSKEQITKLVGNYTPTKYTNNKNMSLANSLWVKSDFKDNIKQSYIDILDAKYAAELKIDDFENANNINSWIKEKTLNIIPQMMSDDDVQELQFALVNALAIDMEWEQKFLEFYEDDNMSWDVDYSHEMIKSDDDWWLRISLCSSIRKIKF